VSAVRPPLLVLALVLSSACGSSSETVTGPSQIRCGVEARADTLAFTQDGGSGTLRITTARECHWSAQSDAAWLTLTPPMEGQGDATIAFRVVANADPVARTGAISVADQRVQVSQAARPCAFELSPPVLAVDAGGGERTVQIGASSAQCRWTAASDVPWISITSAREGIGGGPIAFRVDALVGPARAGNLTIAGQVLRVEQAADCGVTVGTAALSFTAAGGRGEIPVAAPPGCGWTAQSQAPWISIVGNAAGSGPGTVVVQVERGDSPRTGTVTVAGRVVTITQSQSCTFIVEPATYAAPAAGGTTAFAVRTAAGCAWTASSTVEWIAIAAGHNGSGPGEVRVAVAAHAGAARTASLTIAGQTVTVTQASGCSLTLSAASVSVGAAASVNAVQVATAAGCAWSAGSDNGWISIVEGASGNGPGQVRFSVAANTGPTREGSLAIGGRTLTVSQASGCTYAISPTAQDVSGAGGTGVVTIATAAGCAWTAAGGADWISLSAAGGTGPGQFGFSVAPNQGPPRSATFVLAGQTFTVRQASPCTWTFVPPSHAFDANGGNGAILVIVTGICTWSAVSNASWLTVTSSASGTGSGLVQFVAAPNTGPARTGTLTIGAERYEVVQGGR
jgi:hypothetical protein